MGYLIAALIVLVTGWNGYRSAKRNGTWSNRVFVLAIGGAALIFLVVVLPLIALPMETIQRHPLPFFGLMFGGIGAGVTVMALMARKINRDTLAKKTKPDPTVH